MEKRPPDFTRKFLRWFCPPPLVEGIEGDLLQQFEEDMENIGHRRARRQFLWNVLKFFRPEIILRNRFSIQLFNSIMISNYLKVAGRNIARKKLYSFINAFGLSIAIAFCVLIFMFIKDEKSFDRFHADAHTIFMITETGFNREKFEKGEKEPYNHSAYVPAKLAEVLGSELKEVEAVTRFCEGEGIMKVGDKVLKQQVHFVDSGFFKVFSFPIATGSINRVFRKDSDAVITKEAATKYFGQEDPIGREFTFASGEESVYTIVAVIDTPPANSSINYQLLLHISKRPFFNHNRDNWGAFSYPTFVKLHPTATVAGFKDGVDGIFKKYMGEKVKSWRERENIPTQFKVADFGIINLADVHLNTKVSWHKSSDPSYSYILSSIAILILLIAAINYISLALTTSASRRVEVGIRKVVGAQRSQLVYQFGVEAVILALISMLFGIFLVVLFLPAFNEFTSKQISFTATDSIQYAAVAFGISVLVGALAGSYPAVFLSGFRPVSVLKGRFTSKLHAGFTKPLVVLQFALSAFLIISAMIMYRQMEFVTTKDLGYRQNHIIVLQTNAGWNAGADRVVEQFRNKLKDEPEVKAVAGTNSSFNHGWSRYGYRINDVNKSAFVYRVDPYYVELLGLRMKEGRNFSENIPADSTAIIVNEALVKDMGWTDPLNEYLNWREDSLGQGSRVIGVLEDYHFLSLEEEIAPMFLSMDSRNVGYLTEIMISIDGNNVPRSLEKVRSAWAELHPDKPFDYSFLDQDIRRQYEKYERWMNIAGLSTVFAIVIACLGLFGLAGVNAINRTREIGIRKVMGAELANIFVMLNRQYLLMAVISFAIAAPFSYYLMDKWISEFRFRVEIGWELFAFSMISGLALALLTVSYHGFRAATINPAETLKYE